MNPESFPSFKELITKTSTIAADEGFRFRGFKHFPNHETFLKDFAERLTAAADETPLRDDLNRAILICESEAIRKVMIVTCKELGIWPQEEGAKATGPDSWTSPDSPLTQTAYALWMHQHSLDSDQVLVDRHKILTMTAFFIVDFAHAAGIPEAAKTTEGGKKLLMDFLDMAKKEQPGKVSFKKALKDVIRDWATPGIRKDLWSWLDSNWDGLLIGGVAFAVGVTVASLLAKRH